MIITIFILATIRRAIKRKDLPILPRVMETHMEALLETHMEASHLPMEALMETHMEASHPPMESLMEASRQLMEVTTDLLMETNLLMVPILPNMFITLLEIPMVITLLPMSIIHINNYL